VQKVMSLRLNQACRWVSCFVIVRLRMKLLNDYETTDPSTGLI
jgi:hypothetical protein